MPVWLSTGPDDAVSAGSAQAAGSPASDSAATSSADDAADSPVPDSAAASALDAAAPDAADGTGEVGTGDEGESGDGQAASAAEAPGGRGGRLRGWARGPGGRVTGGHLILLACFIAAGIGVTWPMAAYLFDGKLLAVNDISSYVWALWWMAHAITHGNDPWFTHYMAAPGGIELGYDTLMPLPALIMTPVTLLFGPVASFSVLTLIVPGLLCYVTYRAARLWLGQIGAIAAGALFGLCTMVDWQNTYHLNISLGTLFLPLTLETAIRLKRTPGARQGVLLGLVLGASVLTNQESAVLAVLLAAAILVPWLIRDILRLGRDTPAIPWLRTLLLGGVVALIVASPQLVAMLHQSLTGGTHIAPRTIYQLTKSYFQYGVGLPTLFSPSPQLAHYHLGQLATAYQFAEHTEGRPTFGVVLAALGVIGLVLTWRRQPPLRWMGLLWLAGAALALGPRLMIGNTTYVPVARVWDGVRVSLLMPYTWLIRIPGLSALREADRLALLGLLGAAILAGAAVQWLRDHTRPAVAIPAITVIAVLAAAEAGWAATGTAQIPSTYPAVTKMIAADPTGSIVADVPFGLRGGVGLWGQPLKAQELVEATADGHPRAISYTSWVPQSVINNTSSSSFFYHLNKAQNGAKYPNLGPVMARVRKSAILGHVRWALVWHKRTVAGRPTLFHFLRNAGFHLKGAENFSGFGVTVWKRSH